MTTTQSPYIHEESHIISEERVRIGRDLHDGPMQHVVHVAHKLEFIDHLLENGQPHRAQFELQAVRTTLETCIQALRCTILSLLSAHTETPCIAETLQDILQRYRANTPELRTVWEVDGLDGLPLEYEKPLFFFVQEALHNVRKHADATEVIVCISLAETACIAEVRDNGIGLRPEYVAWLCNRPMGQHLGLCIMQQRVQAVGGTLEFLRNGDKGTYVKATFPLRVV